MIDISLNKNLDLYLNYNKCLNFLSDIKDEDFQYPKEKVNFHVYTEVKTDKELECIKSYLATQNLEKTNIIIWSDYDISDNPLIQPYKKYVEMRVYDPVKESKDTILENNKTWILGDISDTKHYMKSGILRFLVTNKYGGIWADMDMIFLRDFKQILDQEWAYMWGSEIDFVNFGPCAAMMSFNKKSHLSNMCLEEICKTQVQKDSTVLDHMLLAKVYRKNPFTVFPSTFFNTEWQLNTTYINGIKNYDPNGLGTKVESGWFTKNEYSSYLFKNAFSWHWHNSSYKNRKIEKGSKFDLLREITNNLLKTKGIH